MYVFLFIIFSRQELLLRIEHVLTWLKESSMVLIRLSRKLLSGQNIAGKKSNIGDLSVVAKPDVRSHKDDEGCTTDNGGGKLLLGESRVHIEFLVGSVLFVHILGQLEIKKSHLVVCKVRGKSDVKSSSAVARAPFRVMIFLLAEFTNLLDECISMLESVELK